MNLAAEAALLGAVLADNKVLDELDFLQPQHFADELNAATFRAIRERATEGRLVDCISLASAKLPEIEAAGAGRYLASLLASMVSIKHAAEYGRVVVECWQRRVLIEMAANVSEALYANGDPAACAAKAMAAVEQVSAAGPRQPVFFSQALDRANEASQSVHRGEVAALFTGIAPVDAIWQGLWPGDLNYLMARSGTGKTPCMMQIARNVAMTGAPVHVISLEMTAASLANLGLCATTRWTADQLRAGDIGGPEDWLELDRARRALASLPIIIDDAPEMDLPSLQARAAAVCRRHGSKLLCIDYRDLIRRPQEQARMMEPEWVRHLGYSLKAMAKTLAIPVVCLVQVNKPRDRDQPAAPTKADLPYTGGQEADGIYSLHRPILDMPEKVPAWMVTPKRGGEKDEAAANWASKREAVRDLCVFTALKRRFGPLAHVDLHFDGPRQLLGVARDPAEGVLI